MKVDVYAYALTMFYVFCRAKPWEALTNEAIEKAVLSKQRPEFPTEISETNQLKHVEIKSVIVDGWQHDPKVRPEFSTILEMLMKN